MRRSLVAPVLGASLVVVSGCATVRPEPGLHAVGALLHERAAVTVPGSRSGRPEDAAALVAALLERELTVDGAVQIALLNNRELRATLRELGVADAELHQARLVQNPTLHGNLRFPDSPFTIGVTQDLVDLVLRPVRTRVASARQRETRLRVAHELLDGAAEVRLSFYDHQAALQVRTMRRASLAAASVAADLSERQFAAGTVNRLELDNMQALHDEARLALDRSETEVATTREELNRRMGLAGADAGWVVVEELPEPAGGELDVAGLEAWAIAQRLDLRATVDAIEAARGEVPLARYARFPAIGVGFEFERESDGERTIGPALEIALPLFDRGQAAASGANARLEQARDRQAALAIGIRAEVRAAHARLAAAGRQLREYRDVILPRRARIVAETQREYNYMLVGVYQLLQAKSSEIDARRDTIEAQRDYWHARTELERAVGGRFESTPITAAEASLAHPVDPIHGPHE